MSPYLFTSCGVQGAERSAARWTIFGISESCRGSLVRIRGDAEGLPPMRDENRPHLIWRVVLWGRDKEHWDSAGEGTDEHAATLCQGLFAVLALFAWDLAPGPRRGRR